jgi:hypothetical protein
VLLLPFTDPVIVAGYTDVQVKPPTVVQDVGSCTSDTAPEPDSVVDVVVDDERVVVDELVRVVVDNTVVSKLEEAGNAKPTSRAQVATSSPSRQQNPATGAHHVPASQ